MKRYVLFVLVALVLSAPVLTHADEKLAELPDVISLDINTFVSQSLKIEKKFIDEELNFNVQIPKDFRERDFSKMKISEKDEFLYGNIYRSDGVVVQDVRPYFQVKSIELQRYISAKNWLIHNMLTDGGTLRGIDSDEKGDKFEALYVRLDRLGNTEVVRARGQLHGRRLVLAEYVVPLLLWDAQRDIQTYVIKSFEFVTKNPGGTIEPMRSYSFFDSFSMSYPASWRLTKENADLENQVDLSFLSAGETKFIFAYIDLSLISDQSLLDPADRSRYPVDMPGIVAKRKQKVDDMGFLIDPVMERKQYNLGFKTELQITEVYPLHRKISDYVTHRKAPITHEFWITAIKGSPEIGKNYVISMVAPARNESMYEWALSAKTYELMIESLR